MVVVDYLINYLLFLYRLLLFQLFLTYTFIVNFLQLRFFVIITFLEEVINHLFLLFPRVLARVRHLL